MTQSTTTTRDSSPTRRPEAGPKVFPLDTGDSRIESARRAERQVYEYYGVEFTEHYVTVAELGLQMRVVEVGTGPPAVLITGGNGVGLEWAPLLPELSGHTLYVMDRPGAGFSDGIDHRTLPFREQAISTTEALFDHFGLDTAPIVGNSIGGHWAIRFALEQPARVSSIALLGCPGFYPGTSAPLPLRVGSVPVVGTFLFRRFIQADDADGARDNWEFLGQSRETIERLPEEYAEGWYRMQNLPHAELAWVSLLQSVVRIRGAVPAVALTPEDLRNVAVPVLLVWGSGDTFGSVEQGRRGAKYIPDAAFHEVGVGHLPWLDEPAVCGELIREFIEHHR